MSGDDGVLLPHGGYEHLRSYKVAEAVYGATVVFQQAPPQFLQKEFEHVSTTVH